MKIHVHKIITEDDIMNAQLIDDGKDELTISTDAIIIDLVNKLTIKEEQQFSKALKKEGMQIEKDKNGRVKYFS